MVGPPPEPPQEHPLELPLEPPQEPPLPLAGATMFWFGAVFALHVARYVFTCVHSQNAAFKKLTLCVIARELVLGTFLQERQNTLELDKLAANDIESVPIDMNW